MSRKAAVFAGQGAQYVGMGKDIHDAIPACKELFDRANETLGYDLAKTCFEGPEEDLTRTDKCQPAIFVVSMACKAALEARGGDVGFVAATGLSLGEWSALHSAGALGFEETIRLLEARGRFMQEACDARAGGMVSVIGLAAEDISRICEQAGVEISNLNSAAQTVLSGEVDKVAQAEQLAKDAGAKRAVVLKVAGAYHSTLMAPAAEKLAEALSTAEVADPAMPVISNVTGEPHASAAAIRDNMIAQVTSTVRWFEGIECLKASGVTEYVEFGPGKVLSGLIRRIDKEATVSNVQDIESLEKVLG